MWRLRCCSPAGWIAVAIPLIAATSVNPALNGEETSFHTRGRLRTAAGDVRAAALAPHNSNLSRPQAASQNSIQLARQPLSSIAFNVMPPDHLVPPDVATSEFSRTIPGADPWASRPMTVHFLPWAPSGLFHQPLYFEDAALERYGQTHSRLLQPVFSGVNFFSNVAILPYKMGVDPPHRHIYTLGYCRPGSWAPSENERLPWSWRGALLQTGAVVGGVYLFP